MHYLNVVSTVAKKFTTNIKVYTGDTGDGEVMGGASPEAVTGLRWLTIICTIHRNI